MPESISRWTDNRKETMRLWMREKRKERKKLGLCVVCGSAKAIENRVRCDKCTQRDQKRQFDKKNRGNMDYEDINQGELNG